MKQVIINFSEEDLKYPTKIHLALGYMAGVLSNKNLQISGTIPILPTITWEIKDI